MNINILWKLEVEQKLWYMDFEVEGINGVFRVANSDGIDLDRHLVKISGNSEFFKHVVEVGVSTAFEEAYTSRNFSGGWEWQETTHQMLNNWCLLASCTSWFTCPFGGKLLEVQSMHKLHPNIQSSGVELLYSWNSNRQPSRVCYFFPNQQNGVQAPQSVEASPE